MDYKGKGRTGVALQPNRYHYVVTTGAIKVEGPSPFAATALTFAETTRGLVGEISLPVSERQGFNRVVEKPQRRPAFGNEVAVRPESENEQLKLALEMSKVNAVQIVAQTGAGKSTRYPLILSDLIKGPILVIEPNAILVANSCEFVSVNIDPNVTTYAGCSSQHERRKFKVVYATANEILSDIITQPSRLDDYRVVYLDEAHDTSGAYYALRCYLFDRKGPARIMLASATMGSTNLEGSDAKRKVRRQKNS